MDEKNDPVWDGPGPGDPTPVPGGQVSLAVGLGKGCLGRLGEGVLEVVGGMVLLVLTTASLAAVFLLSRLAYDHSPVATGALAAAGAAGLGHGVRQLRRAKGRRSRLGRVTAAVTAGLGFWALLCVGYASFGEALDLASVGG